MSTDVSTRFSQAYAHDIEQEIAGMAFEVYDWSLGFLRDVPIVLEKT
jgi:hypothetical protein